MSINRLHGVTILEVIIAIIIFGTGILVILSMITKNVSWVYEIKQRDTATLLAKEGLEMVYNIRDGNVDRGIEWNCAIVDTGSADNCSTYFYYGSTGYTLFTASLTITGRYSMSEISNTGSTWLYLHTGLIEQQDGSDILTGFWYTHESTGGVQSAFRRYITFKPVPLYATDDDKILYVSSTVEYLLGNRVKSIVLESLVGSSR